MKYTRGGRRGQAERRPAGDLPAPGACDKHKQAHCSHLFDVNISIIFELNLFSFILFFKFLKSYIPRAHLPAPGAWDAEN